MPLSERDQRTLKIGGAIIGVLLVAFLLLNVLGGGDDAPPGEETARPSETAEPGDGGEEPTPSASLTPTGTLSPVAVFSGRDPFSVPPGFSTAPTDGGTTGTGGTTTTPPPTSPTGTGTDGGPDGTFTSSPPPTQPGNGSSSNTGGHEVVLLNVFSVDGVPTVQVEVDGTIHDVQTGDEFGPNDRFEVRSISGNCATFVYGDEAFTLCVEPQK